MMGFCELRVDNCQCQVQEEEGSYEHEREEVQKDDVCVGFLHHPLDFTPAFQGD